MWRLEPDSFFPESAELIENSSENRGHLQWHECAEKISSPLYVCATLDAPLDYTNLIHTCRAKIEVIRYKAGAGHTSRDSVLGSVLLNPGGPGGSGISFLRSSARDRRNKTTVESLDEIFKGKYDLVSFDPHGVGATWPKVQCFDDADAELYYENSTASWGMPGQHGSRVIKHEIGYLVAQQHMLGGVCGTHTDAELFKNMSTLSCTETCTFCIMLWMMICLTIGGLAMAVVGTTYAAMFPDDINRLIIDGVVDTPNYYQGLWSNNLLDAEEELDGFFAECVKSGPENCELAKLGDNSSGSELKEKVLNWANTLKIEPLTVFEAKLTDLR